MHCPYKYSNRSLFYCTDYLYVMISTSMPITEASQANFLSVSVFRNTTKMFLTFKLALTTESVVSFSLFEENSNAMPPKMLCGIHMLMCSAVPATLILVSVHILHTLRHFVVLCR